MKGEIYLKEDHKWYYIKSKVGTNKFRVWTEYATQDQNKALSYIKPIQEAEQKSHKIKINWSIVG